MVRPLTTTGVDVLVVVPSPNWPKALAPQHLAVPFVNNAHEWLPPPLTVTGVAAVMVKALLTVEVRVPSVAVSV